MESDEESLAERMRIAERAAAAPYVDYPVDPWWAAPGFGVFCAVWAVLVGLPDDVALVWQVVAVLAMLVMVAGLGAYFGYQRRRWGAFPCGKPPREIASAYVVWLVFWVIFLGLIWVIQGQIGLIAGVVFAFVGGAGGFWVYCLVYGRAVRRLGKRVA